MFEELQGWNLEFKLINPRNITLFYLGTMQVIFDFIKYPYLTHLMSYIAQI